jgi:hypothetical protein
MIGQAVELWPSDGSALAAPPFSDFSLVGPSSTGCTQEVQNPVTGVIRCVEKITIVPYRTLTQARISMERTSSSYATSATPTIAPASTAPDGLAHR